MTEPILYKMEEAADVLKVRRTTVYNLLAKGEIASVHIGRRRLITADSVAAYIERLRTCESGYR